MADQTPQKWAEAFAEDLVLDGERVPFDRVVQRHHQEIIQQRAKGLTWKGLANLLRRAGATRENGRAYTADHLRVAFARIEGGTSREDDVRPLVPAPSRARSDKTVAVRKRAAPPAAKAPGPQLHPMPEASTRSGDKDVSDDELDLAMDRINKMKQ